MLKSVSQLRRFEMTPSRKEVEEAVKFYNEWHEPDVRSVAEVRFHNKILISVAQQVLENGMGLEEERIEKICYDHILLGTSEFYKMLPHNIATTIHEAQMKGDKV